MNKTGNYETKRVNRTLIISWAAIILILFSAYSLEVIKHTRTVAYIICFSLSMIVPFLIVVLIYFRNKEWEYFGYAVAFGYSFMYTFVMFTGATQMVSVYILPLLCFLVLYHRPRLILDTFLLTMAINVSSLLYQLSQKSINITNSKDVEIRFAAITVCFAGGYVSAKLYDNIHKDNVLYVNELNEKNSELQDMAIQTIATIANTIDAKDEYTKGHSKRVAEICAAIAAELGMSKDEINKIRSIALLHDIGKIGIPDSVLNKPGKLTSDEYELMKQHTVIGSEILKDIKMIEGIDIGAKSHHEKYDGTGYPDNILGENIPYIARIIAVADAFDAMTSNRVYRNKLDIDYVIKEFKRCRGTQFDPKIADILIKLVEENRIRTDIVENTENEGVSEISKIWSRVMQKEEEKYKNAFDELTGLLLRAYGEEKIVNMIKERPGALVFCDMDNLKTINDRFGHKSGDKALKILGGVIGGYGEKGVACRVGGDEFLLYLDGVTENKVIEILESIAADFNNEIQDDTTINLATISAGVCLSSPTDSYSNVLSRADKALYHVKQRGKAGYYIYHEELEDTKDAGHVDINQITKSILDAGKYDGALDVEYRQFTKMYKYINEVCERYRHTCNVVLVTLNTKPTTFIDEIEQGMKCMETAIKKTIRSVDICSRYSSVQFLIVLLEAGDENVSSIMNRIFASFYKMNTDADIVPTYEVSTLYENGKDK